MGKTPSETEVEGFREAGYINPVDVLDEDAAEHFRQKTASLFAAGTDRSDRAAVKISFKMPVFRTWMDGMPHHPAALDAIEDVIGPDILIWSSALFIKDGGDDTFAAWHQDSKYSTLKGMEQVSAEAVRRLLARG